MDDVVAIAILGIVALGVWLWLRRKSDVSHKAETRLRRICLDDTAQVERLINAEMGRTPGISRAEAADRAVLRYERDNR